MPSDRRSWVCSVWSGRGVRRVVAPRAAFRRASKVGWGLIDQAASSATNLLLTVATARVVGPRSLGIVVIGFTAYIFLLGLQRAGVSEPLVVLTSAAPAEERSARSRSAVTATMIGGMATSTLMLVTGVSVGGTFGRALILFSVWMPFALLQDLWRSMLFRDSRGAAATANDSIWLGAMALALVLAWRLKTDWAIVSAWGLGASAGAVAGFAQLRLLPSSPSKAWKHLRRDFWPYGRWLFGGSIVAGAGSQGSVFLTAALLGPASLGGLRAVQSVFAPLSLLGPAIALPALPAMTRRLAVAPQAAISFALRLSALLSMLATAYVVPVSLGGDEVLKGIFGVSFQAYHRLVLPIVVQQIIAAGGGGFMLLMLANRSGRKIFGVNLALVPVTLCAIAIGDAAGGLLGVAWAIAVVAVVSLLATAVLAMARLRPHPRPPTIREM
jgi:O-antigen/teichoic acid export membrane protein